MSKGHHVPKDPWSRPCEPCALGSQVRSQPLAEHAKPLLGVPCLSYSWKLEEKKDEKKMVPVPESYLRWDNLHFCLFWFVPSHPRDIREPAEGHGTVLSFP